MAGNDKKRLWEHHLGVGRALFNHLGRPGRSSGIIKRDFDVDSQNSKVMRKSYFFIYFRKVTKYHEMIRNEQKSVWEHHLGVGTMTFGPRRA